MDLITALGKKLSKGSFQRRLKKAHLKSFENYLDKENRKKTGYFGNL